MVTGFVADYASELEIYLQMGAEIIKRHRKSFSAFTNDLMVLCLF